MDIFLYKRKKILAAAVVTVICCLLMVAFPTTALYSARKGISLWISNVLPALLPFFICANFLQNLGVLSHLKAGVFPFAMSVLSGYPMGAKIIGDLKRNGEISLREAERLMSFCSTSGPAFMVSAVGAGMLSSGTMGIIIAVSHYAGAMLNGIIYTKILGREINDSVSVKNSGRCTMQESFTEAILMSFRALGIILAYIVIFMFATDLIHLSGIMSFVESREMQALIKGFFEVTVGCGAVAECQAASDVFKCVLCSFIMSWGGLSVLGQTMSMLSGTGIHTGYLVLSKLTHGLFSGVVAFIISFFVL